MKTHLTLSLLAIFLITCLARSVSTDFSFQKPTNSILPAIPIHQKKMVWHYYQAKTDTPWILVQKQKLSNEIPAPYYGGFDFNGTPLKQLHKLVVTCPHNKDRCTDFYIAQAHGFTTPHKRVKGNDYEWVKVRDITTSPAPDHGVWAHTRNNQQVLICPMLAKALRSNQKAV